jgi:hypothetical protein
MPPLLVARPSKNAARTRMWRRADLHLLSQKIINAHAKKEARGDESDANGNLRV